MVRAELADPRTRTQERSASDLPHGNTEATREADMSDWAVMGVGILMALVGAFMAEGVWGAITALGFIVMLFGWGGYLADYIIKGG